MKKKIRLKTEYDVNNLRWVHTIGNHPPRLLMSVSVFKQRSACTIERRNIALHVTNLILEAVSNIHKTFDRTITASNGVSS